MCLSIDRISFNYPNGPDIFADATWTFDQGGYHLVRGPSGAGKSTLLRLLCRLEEITSGVILYKDTDVTAMDPPQLRRTVAYVQQTPTLIPGTVRENLLLPFSFQANRALALPTDSDLAERLDSFLLDGVTPDSAADKLSVGQSQRVCLIRSLLLEPEVVLLDEPTSSLDPKSAKVVLDKTAELSGRGVTVVMISHSETTPPGVTDAVTIRQGRLVRA
ncbi:ABC transporter ATP-binding protein [Pseudodesulfovibrio portus]|uniref:ABC transporter domain-containing protein n=1 Tax=Pseudodesulfovibrio portus TaxID=231439 RepID=A0ABN6RU11_9BACT|nr:ATP-binding cassette domain-containing protein [Pseudodesulfovibrio portus]BDQ34602.1 hypothetical protein JCM14722_21440 [Pseudodesulfovibrio portus]